jgi:hypothetical protein
LGPALGDGLCYPRVVAWPRASSRAGSAGLAMGSGAAWPEDARGRLGLQGWVLRLRFGFRLGSRLGLGFRFGLRQALKRPLRYLGPTRCARLDLGVGFGLRLRFRLRLRQALVCLLRYLGPTRCARLDLGVRSRLRLRLDGSCLMVRGWSHNRHPEAQRVILPKEEAWGQRRLGLMVMERSMSCVLELT